MRMATSKIALLLSLFCKRKQRLAHWIDRHGGNKFFCVQKRKNLIKKWRFIFSTFAASISASYTFAAENNVTASFSGYVTQCICQLADNSTNVDVEMDTVAASSFSNVGVQAGHKKFVLRFKNCPPSAKLHIAWTGRRIPLTNTSYGPVMRGLVALDGAGQNNVAKGVGLSLMRADEQVWELSQDSPFTTNADGTATVDLVAAYQSIAPAVEGGSARVSAFFTINYKQY